MWLVLFHSNCVFFIFYVRTGKSQQATEARYLRDRLVVHKIEMNLLHDAASSSSSSLVVCRLSLCFGFVN